MRLSRSLTARGDGSVAIGPPSLGNAAAIAAAALAALVAGAFAVRSLQAAAALALLVLVVAVHGQSRRAGLVSLWTLWLLAPALRRLLALVDGAPSADPLALLPFVATGAIALIELRRTTMSKAARTTMLAGGLGILIGAPMGLLADPMAFAFGLAAYLAGLSAIVLGWGDGREGGRQLTLTEVLLVGLPPLAAYAILQYFFPLPAWDSHWVDTADLASLGSPQEGHIRVFSTLNSPGTFGLVLALGVLLGLGVRRRAAIAVPATAVVLTALALTFVRSAWLSLVLGVIVFAAAARGRAAGKVVAVIAVCLVAVVVVGGSNPTTKAFTQRITSLGELSDDDSAQDRLAFSSELLPTAVGQPLGAGVGQAGLSVRLDEGSGSESLESTDNGYLALIYQLGLVGFLLVAFAMARSVLAAIRGLGSAGGLDRQAGAALLATLVALVVSQAAGDVLYGITGAVFWYLAGVAFANEEHREEEASREAEKPLLKVQSGTSDKAGTVATVGSPQGF
jgi:hypothetical protein